MNKNIKIHYILLFLICTIAFVLRMWGWNFGLPGLFHLDERIFPVDAFYRLSHKGQIPIIYHSYPYGDLIPNILAVFYGMYYLILKFIKIVHIPFDFLVLYMRDPSSVYLIGRMLFVLSSTASVFVLYLIGKRLCNKTVGFLSAFFLAFNFLSIQQAKFMKGDTLGTLLMLISVYFCFPQKEEEDVNGQIKRKKYILTGIFAGFAIAARFTLVVYLIVPVIVFLMDKKILFANKIKNCLIFILCSISTFLILTPSVIFRWYIFFINMLSLGIQVGEASKSINSNSAWMIHMNNGIGIPLAIIGILGMLYSLYKKENISLIVFVVLFGSAVFSLATPSWHAIAIIPFIVFFAAKFIYEISIIICKKKPKTRHFFLAVVSILAVIPPLLNVLKYNYLISCPDTRNLAKEFIEKTIPPESKIVSEGMEYFEQTSILGVPINKSKKQLQEQFDKVKKEGFGGALVLAEIKGQKEPSYTLENILILEDPPYKNEKYDTTVEIYLEHNIDYLIMSSWVRDCSWNYDTYIMPEKFAISLEKEYEIIKEFIPNPVFGWDYYCFSKIDYNALSKVAIWHRKIIGGPIIKIYKKRISPLPICQTDKK
ncbi:MAG: glycosyltransferase family 39 protein [bacterium]|nr:glycosyltransferase family 39 protein [bacterium]